MTIAARMLLLALALVLGWRGEAWAQQQSALEQGVKATFLYRFASFVEWPEAAFAAADTPIALCVVGDAAFAVLVENVANGERISGRTITVRALPAVAESSDCHIVYAAGALGQSVTQALNAVHGRPVLTVTDAAHGQARGAIHFVTVDGRVRFHIDRDAAAANQVSLNSRLLNIALSVRGGAGG